jgi:hypothetical protein
MEEEMRILSQAEIARCSKRKLHALLHVIASELPQLAGEFAGAARGALQPAQYPHRSGAAGFPAALSFVAG